MTKKAETWFKTLKDKIIGNLLIFAGCGVLFSMFLVGISKWAIIQQLLSSLGLDENQLGNFTEVLIYGTIALFAIVLGIERSVDMAKLRQNLETQSKAMDTLSEKISLISQNYQEIVSRLNFLKGRIELTNHIDFPNAISEAILHHVPSDLQKLFQNKLNDYTEYLYKAIVQKRINFNDADLFSEIYRRWLEEHPNTTIYATSSPLSKYYWTKEGEKNTRIENTIASFIEKGGEMYRIFFVTKEDLADIDVISRINKQVNLGVKVYISEIGKNESELELFVIDKINTLTLRIYTNSDMSMKNFSCLASEGYHKRFINKWKALIDLNTTNMYEIK